MSSSTLEMHAPCNAKISVTDGGAGFKLNENCPAGAGAGELVANFLERCRGCSQRQNSNVVLDAPTQPAPPADLPPMPLPELPAPTDLPPMPLPELPPMPASLTLPTPIDAPPLPEMVMPAPVDAPVTVVDKRTLPKETDDLIPLEAIKMLNGMSLGESEANIVDLDDVFKQVPDLPGVGPSEGGFSPHTMMDASCLRRFFLKHILGMRMRSSKRAFQQGSLYHAVMAMRYSGHPDRQYEPLERAAEAGLGELAYKIKAMCVMQFEKFAGEEAKHWCPRAVEHNMVAWLPCKIGKRTVLVPLSCRADMILALKRADEPHPAWGPCPQGVYLFDWKTSSGITADLLEGYGMDYQFLTESVIFKLSNAHQQFGQLRGVMVSLASTARKQPTFDDFTRIECPISEAGIIEFMEQELRPTVSQLYEMMTDPVVRADINAWPMDRRLCIGRWGRCEMFDYCDRQAGINYKIDEHRMMDLDRLAKPPQGWKVPDIGAPLPADEPATGEKPEKPKPEEDPNVELLATSILAQIEGAQQGAALYLLQRQSLLVPGHTIQSVTAALGRGLRGAYEQFAEEKKTFGMGGREWRFQKTGVTWKAADGSKGRVSWGHVATWICKKVWFNLSTALPE